MRKFLFLLAVIFQFGNPLLAQTVKTVGATGSDYTTLRAAFNAINAGTLTGDIELQIKDNTTETASAVLYQSGYNSTSSYTSVSIYPTVSGKTITYGTYGSPTIDLNNADNVTIDGRVNRTGSTPALNIVHTDTYFNSMAVRFTNDATSNTLKYLTLKSGYTSGAVVEFTTSIGTTGNSDNIIEYCKITRNGSSQNSSGINSSGSATAKNQRNVIRYNEIYDLFNQDAVSYIGLWSNSEDFIIEGNSLYQTTDAVRGTNPKSFIRVSSAGHTIKNNYIGGKAANCGGSPLKVSSSGNSIWAIIIDGGTVAKPNSIQGNIIRNFDLATTNGGFIGIQVSSGIANVGTETPNEIGSLTNATSIQNTAAVYGIQIDGSSPTVLVKNNIIAGIVSNNSIYGIFKLNGGSSVQGNTIAKLKVTSSGTSNLTGIEDRNFSGSTVSGNLIYALINESANKIYGINAYGSTIANNIIVLEASTTAEVLGINKANSGALNLYHNTVYIGGTPASGAINSFAYYGSNSSADNRNNIFYNAASNTGGATGTHYAIGLTSSPTTLNYNIYYATGTSGGVLGQFNGTNKTTLADWKTATAKDVNSVSADPYLSNPGGTSYEDYNISVSTPGVKINTVTTDYIGALRTDPPAIGALELACLVPTITSFTPTTAFPGQTITITGTNFSDVTAVKFNGIAAASYTVVDATTITAVVPSGSVNGKLSVITACNTALSATDFTANTPGTGDLTITTTGETGTSGTNWFTSGNTLISTGLANVHPNVLTNLLTNAGNLKVYHLPSDGKIFINSDILSTASGKSILFRAEDDITVDASVRIETDGGDITLWSDYTASGTPNGGGIQIKNNAKLDSRTATDRTASKVSDATGGGIITLGGGLDDGGVQSGITGGTAGDGLPDGHASNYDGSVGSATYGILLGTNIGGTSQNTGIRFYSGGGNMNLAASSVSADPYGLMTYQGYLLDAGTNGNINMFGKAVGTAGYSAAFDMAFYRGTAVASVIRTAGTGRIAITGAASGGTISNLAFAADGSGVGSNGGITIAANGSGTVTLNATTGNIRLNNADILAASGAISMFGLGGGELMVNNFPNNGTVNIGQASYAGSPITASSSNLLFQFDKFNFVGTTAMNLAGTGEVTIQSNNSANFSTAFSLHANLNLANTLTKLSIGRNTNTANINLNKSTTINGPVNIYGGIITLNQNLNTTAANANGDILLKATDNISLAANKSITTNGGDVILWADADASGTTTTAGGTIFLLESASISTAGGNIVLAGGADQNSDGIPDGYAIGQTATPSHGTDISANAGLFLDNAAIDAGTGNVLLRGQGTGNLINYQIGTRLYGGSIKGADINIEAKGSIRGASSSNWGLSLEGFSITASGDITLNGWGGRAGSANTDANQVGVDIRRAIDNTSKHSEIKATGSGLITINGVGGSGAFANFNSPSSAGIRIEANQTNPILSENGVITLNGTSGYSGRGSAIMVGSPISSTNGNIILKGNPSVDGTLNENGNIDINSTITTGAELKLESPGAVSQTAAITANKLALIGTGTFSLTNTANDVNILAAGESAAKLGNLSFTDADDLTIGTVNPTGIISTGTIEIATLSGNLSIAENISTTNTTDNAIKLYADKNKTVGDGTGGQIIISGSPTITVGSGGRASLYSGNSDSSTGLTALVTEANTRTSVDATTTTFSPVLGSGIYALYRSIPCEENNGLSFDGSNDYVSVNQSNLSQVSTAVTLEAWVYFDNNSDAIREIFTRNKNTTLTVDVSYALRTIGRKLTLHVADGTQYYVLRSVDNIPSNTWVHVAGTFQSGTGGVLYMNGKPVSSTPNDGSISSLTIGNHTGTQANIGRYPFTSDPSGGRNYFNGQIDEVRIWNVVRTASEIESQYTSVLTGEETGLLAYYNFNQGVVEGDNTSTTSLVDGTGNNNNGSLNSFALNGSSSNWIHGFITPITGSGNTIMLGDDIQLSNPMDGGEWSSSDEAVATVDASGLVSSLSAGTTTISYSFCDGRTATYTITVISVDAAQSTLSPTSASIIANGTSTQVLTVTAKNALGVALTSGGATVTITKLSGTGTIGTVTDNQDGTYTATVTSPTLVGSGVFVATINGSAVKSGNANQTESTINYIAGPASQLTMNTIAQQRVGTTFSVTLTTKDAFGNIATVSSNSNISLSLGSSSVSLGGNLSGTIASGTSSVTISDILFNSPGTGVSLKATQTSGTPDLSQVTSNTFVVIDIPPSNLVYTPSTQTIGLNVPMTSMTPSSGGGAVVSYEISPALPASLNFDTTTGIVSGTLTEQKSGSQTYTIKATNSGGNTTSTFTLTFNSTPTNITLSSDNIDENNALGAIIATLSTTDADVGDTHTYSLESGDTGSFSIAGSTLKATPSFNYEAKKTYSLVIRTTDAGGLYYDKTVTININNVNERPTAMALSQTAIYENNAVNAVIGTLSTTDVDAGDTFSYSLESGDVSAFNLVGGELKASPIYNYSQKNTYNIGIRTTDAGGLSYIKSFEIQILKAPVISGSGNVPGSTEPTQGSNPTISKGFNSNLNVSGADLNTYSWSPSTGLSATNIANPVANPSQTTTYQVTVTNSAGISTTVYVTVYVVEDYNVVPSNILTPDGDGINDKWVVENLETYPNHQVTIFDQAGRILLQTRNYQNNWDGTLNGSTLIEGAYYYVIKFDSGVKLKKGYITLIRQ